MKQITLNIDETKFKAFLSFIKTLDYVSVSDEIDIPIEQQQEAERRLKLVQEGKMKTRSWNQAKQDIFKR
ncbi:MAG: addiction module protein [Bacteroidota bacterium]